MSTYINQIVQITRRMHGARDAEYDTLLAERGDLVLAAITSDAALAPIISWAIDLNDEPAKVQMQKALAHLAAAEALAA